MSQRPPITPLHKETAIQKVRMAEDGWNGQNPEKIALAYTADSIWRNRNEFTRVVTRKPSASIVDGLRAQDIGTPDLAQMLKDHAHYVETLRETGRKLSYCQR